MDEKKEDEPQTPRIVLWALVFVVMLAWRWPAWKAGFEVPDTKLNDFCQDWVSARFYFAGDPVYADQRAALRTHLGRTVAPGYEGLLLELNAHPPSSILAVLPLAAFPYETASRIWSVFWLATLPLSFLIVARSLGMGLPWWSVFPVGTLLLWCNPLGEEFAYGQFNLCLLLLVVSGWASARADQPYLGGALLGIAAVMKLFPAFLFLPYLIRRDWRVLAGGAAAVVVVTALTMVVFGWQAYEDYATKIVPHVSTFRSSWMNMSLPGYFSRFFSPSRGYAESLVESRSLYLALTGLAVLLVLAGCIAAARRDRSVAERDYAFAVAVCGMLLVSPTTWSHYCLLLLMPVLLLWRDLPEPGWGKAVLCLALLVIWVPPFLFHSTLVGAKPDNWWKLAATPAQSVGPIAIPGYALLALFLLMLVTAMRRPADPEPS